MSVSMTLRHVGSQQSYFNQAFSGMVFQNSSFLSAYGAIYGVYNGGNFAEGNSFMWMNGMKIYINSSF